MFRVIVPLVIARGTSGQHVYLYQGASLPAYLVDGEAERLTREGFAVDTSPAPEVPPPPKPRTRKD